MDTNVFISALLKPFSTPADLLRLVLSEQVLLLYDARILSEYREVALRPTFDVDPDRVTTLLDLFAHGGLSVETTPLATPLLDPDDHVRSRGVKRRVSAGSLSLKRWYPTWMGQVKARTAL